VRQANLGADRAFMTGHDAARAAGMGLGEPPTTT
jgi:hypothetical protein